MYVCSVISPASIGVRQNTKLTFNVYKQAMRIRLRNRINLCRMEVTVKDIKLALMR